MLVILLFWLVILMAIQYFACFINFSCISQNAHGGAFWEVTGCVLGNRFPKCTLITKYLFDLLSLCFEIFGANALSQYTFNMPFHVLGYYKPLLLLLSKSYKLKFLKGCVLGTFLMANIIIRNFLESC